MFKKLISSHPILKFLGNRYIIVLVFFTLWIVFVDNTSYLEQIELNNQIEELNNNKKYYQEEIKKDEKNIKLLKDPNQIEKYAREKYYMKRDSEDVYIIDFEEEKIDEKSSKK